MSHRSVPQREHQSLGTQTGSNLETTFVPMTLMSRFCCLLVAAFVAGCPSSSVKPDSSSSTPDSSSVGGALLSVSVATSPLTIHGQRPPQGTTYLVLDITLTNASSDVAL